MSDIHQVKERMEFTGYICTQYAHFDYLISNIIWHVLDMEKGIGVIITGSMEIRPKIDMAIELLDYKEIFPEIRKKLQSIKNSASSSNGFISKRNVIVHGIFSSKEGDPKVMVESHRKKSMRGRQELKLSYYHETHEDIIKANKALMDLMIPVGINVH